MNSTFHSVVFELLTDSQHMKTFLALLLQVYAKIIDVREDGRVWALLWACYSGQQGRTAYHLACW